MCTGTPRSPPQMGYSMRSRTAGPVAWAWARRAVSAWACIWSFAARACARARSAREGRGPVASPTLYSGVSFSPDGASCGSGTGA